MQMVCDGSSLFLCVPNDCFVDFWFRLCCIGREREKKDIDDLMICIICHYYMQIDEIAWIECWNECNFGYLKKCNLLSSMMRGFSLSHGEVNRKLSLQSHFSICNPIVNMQILQYVIFCSTAALTFAIHGKDDTETVLKEFCKSFLFFHFFLFANETKWDNTRRKKTAKKISFADTNFLNHEWWISKYSSVKFRCLAESLKIGEQQYKISNISKIYVYIQPPHMS